MAKLHFLHPVLILTWFLRNHSNMIIWCSIIILENCCAVIKYSELFFKYTTFVWNINILSVISFVINAMHPCWIGTTILNNIHMHAFNSLVKIGNKKKQSHANTFLLVLSGLYNECSVTQHCYSLKVKFHYLENSLHTTIICFSCLLITSISGRERAPDTRTEQHLRK